MEYTKLVREVTKPYQGSNFLYTVGNGVKIDKPIIQYKETDWELVKRLASNFNSILVCYIMKKTPRFYFGLPKGQSYTITNNIPYAPNKDLLAFKKAGGYAAGLDPKNDVVFQKIFGSPENEDILISFLNALLERTEKEKIKHVEYVDTKLSDIEALDDKIGILDVRVITERGIHINVEIQLINKYNMVNRTLFYWSRLYSNQIKKGENYKNLNKTITINILNFNYIESKKYHTTYHLYEDDEKIILTDLLEVHFIELPKFLDEQPELNNSLNKWLAFLTKPEKEVMEVVEMGEPEIRKAITVLDMLSRDPETVRLAELRMKKILDENSMIEGAKEEGKREVAKNALLKGADVLFVSDITGLSQEEVLKLKEELDSH